MTKVDPATRYVRSLEGTYYMVREAAELLGVRHSRLREMLRDDPELGPSYCTFFGKIKIYLYTPDDIVRLQNYLANRRGIFPRSDGTRGRPTMWSEEQRRQRQRLYSSNYYYRQRAHQLRAEGKLDEAEEATARAGRVAAELEKMEPDAWKRSSPSPSPSATTSVKEIPSGWE